VRMDLRSTGGDPNRIRPLAQELVGLQPDIILAVGTPTTVALQRETGTIPIVFVGVTGPVAGGVVPRLDRGVPACCLPGTRCSGATGRQTWVPQVTTV